MRLPALPRAPLAALLALAAVAAGCDSVEPVEVAGPTIQFGAASVNASENDGTVQIPVVLSGGADDQTYTVEVLFGDAASRSASREASGDTLIYGRDIDNFGEADGPNRVTTVSLTGPTDTVSVAVDVIQDRQFEGPEVALFVLQRPSDGAVVGGTRQFRLEIGTPPIADVREREVGSTVTVEGIVTRARGRSSFIQDASGAAIATFATGGAYADSIAAGAVAQGDRIEVVGTLSEFNGLLQVSDITSFDVLSRGNPLPAAQTVTPSQLATGGENYESELVRIVGLTLATGDTEFMGNTSYDVSAGGTTITLRTSREGDTAVVGRAIQPLTGGAPGAYGPFTFTGVVGQFRGTNQLTPVNPSDLQADEED